ncbi:MAG: WG repeat-containing protein [Acidobacteria bacterium]|nr:WG repeat-containing protein [Acidobacteriota bacterium]
MALFRTCIPNGRLYGWIDDSGTVVIEPRFRYASDFSEGLAAVAVNQDTRAEGYITPDGNFSLKLNYPFLGSFQEGRAKIAVGCGSYLYYGFIDSIGQLLIGPDYDEAHNFSEGLAAVRKQEKWGYIDKSGQVVIECRFDDAGAFSEGIAPVSVGGRYGYINAQGDFAVSPTFARAGSFRCGRGNVRFGDPEDGPVGLVDRAGNIIAKHRFQSLSAPCEDRATFDVYADLDRYSYFGYVDGNGNIVIEPSYFLARPFSEGLAAVTCDPHGGSCYIDRTGERAFPGKFLSAREFRNGLAEVHTFTRNGYIDRTGYWVWWCRRRHN